MGTTFCLTTEPEAAHADGRDLSLLCKTAAPLDQICDALHVARLIVLTMLEDVGEGRFCLTPVAWPPIASRKLVMIATDMQLHKCYRKLAGRGAGR
jgi:hypothetical protein